MDQLVDGLRNGRQVLAPAAPAVAVVVVVVGDSSGRGEQAEQTDADERHQQDGSDQTQAAAAAAAAADVLPDTRHNHGSVTGADGPTADRARGPAGLQQQHHTYPEALNTPRHLSHNMQVKRKDLIIMGEYERN